MIIILEGPDCVGKSSVASRLTELLKIPSMKGSSFESAKFDNKELFSWYANNFLDPGSENIIMDRSFYSNRVYASLYKDYSILRLDQVNVLERLIKVIHQIYLVVFITADIDIIKHRLRSRGDDYVKERFIEPILKEYDRVIFSECKLPWIYLNSGLLTSDEIADSIASTIERGY